MTLINCTIAANSAALGGGIATEQQGAVTLRNTLIATNAGGNCLALDSGTLTNGGGNLDDGTSCGLVDGTSSSNASAGATSAIVWVGPPRKAATDYSGRAVGTGLSEVLAGIYATAARAEIRPRDVNRSRACRKLSRYRCLGSLVLLVCGDICYRVTLAIIARHWAPDHLPRDWIPWLRYH